MSETIKLSFDDGYKNIQLGDDPNRIIRINPTDMSFVKRIAGLEDKAKEISEKYGDIDFESINELKSLAPDDPDFGKMKRAAETMDKVERAIRELLDSTFAFPVCDIVFGDTNCVSPVNGMPMYINFIRVIFEYIKSELDKQNAESEAKMSKYINQAEQIVPRPKITAKAPKPFVPYSKPQITPPTNISALSPEEKDALLKQLLT